MLLWRVFQHNVRHLTDLASPTVRCLAVIEHTQTMLRLPGRAEAAVQRLSRNSATSPGRPTGLPEPPPPTGFESNCSTVRWLSVADKRPSQPALHASFE